MPVPGGSGSSKRDALLSFKASLLDSDGHLSSWQGDDCCSAVSGRESGAATELAMNVVVLNLRKADYQNDTLSLLRGLELGRAHAIS
ncbi:hypothetical protein ABZP36_016727 [Zizania latifolia]